MEKINDLINEFTTIPEIEAIALGGSRASGKYDEKSDYDIYIYVTQTIDRNTRKIILSKYCSVMEISNHYWELEDNCTLNNGIDIDIIYRDLSRFESQIQYVVQDFNSFNGYTTCMWHNLLASKIIFDRNGRLKKIQEKYNIPYPKQLKQNIINNNMNLLSGVLPSYDMQIKKASKRHDLVSVNHRVTEFLASYFDIIFAINEKAHPGEKRLIELCKEQCTILPNNFSENLETLFACMYDNEKVNQIIQKVIDELKIILVVL